jgi:hypothetical protein
LEDNEAEEDHPIDSPISQHDDDTEYLTPTFEPEEHTPRADTWDRMHLLNIFYWK